MWLYIRKCKPHTHLIMSKLAAVAVAVAGTWTSLVAYRLHSPLNAWRKYECVTVTNWQDLDEEDRHRVLTHWSHKENRGGGKFVVSSNPFWAIWRARHVECTLLPGVLRSDTYTLMSDTTKSTTSFNMSTSEFSWKRE